MDILQPSQNKLEDRKGNHHHPTNKHWGSYITTIETFFLQYVSIRVIKPNSYMCTISANQF
ncbi:hypothetical protein HanRHA438_Chr03g0136391 [Helianthus annuus]|nr:hypothetical protein HanRHA438_Chr03g0136391 [Helianthus annuus]